GAAYTSNFTFKNRYNTPQAAPPGVYFTENFDEKQLLNDIESAMKIQYGENFISAVIIDTKLEDGELSSSVSLQFEQEEELINKIFSDEACISTSENDGYCIIPPSLVVNKTKLEETIFEPINQCSTPRKVCPAYTSCKKHNGTIEFSCFCEEHFKKIHDYKIGKGGTVEYCNDIDECASPSVCPSFTECMNTIGSYSCPCVEGYKPKSTDDGPKVTGCIGVCSDSPCGTNGECEATTLHNFYCKCAKGYTGIRCEERDTFLSAAMKNTAIVGTALGSVILLFIIGTALVIFRLKKRNRNEQR
ncbi:latent-transforming growth factor beta-binding protein 1-like, partial [Limulus polyphemus]|uniref:Latent-transforming growth factor beta-binding protein 1-like n=1 Tax=Limulus polyphemus TaxID=6850 RepID=A0ABM1RXB9_LIMPO